MSAPAPDAVERLIDAAAALLEARANQMVTALEWQRLREALAACGRTIPTEDSDAPD